MKFKREYLFYKTYSNKDSHTKMCNILKRLQQCIKQDIRIYIYICCLAGQTAGPIGLKFFMNTVKG